MSASSDRIHAVLFGLSPDLAAELTAPLCRICTQIESIGPLETPSKGSQIIFCGPDSTVVRELRKTHSFSAIVVVSRLPEVNDWLDSIEAGATDYCAAPFELGQVQWIVDTSMRSRQTALAA